MGAFMADRGVAVETVGLPVMFGGGRAGRGCRVIPLVGAVVGDARAVGVAGSGSHGVVGAVFGWGGCHVVGQGGVKSAAVKYWVHWARVMRG